jgi:hypothetical protein
MPKSKARKFPNKDGALVKIQSQNFVEMEQRNSVTHRKSKIFSRIIDFHFSRD